MNYDNIVVCPLLIVDRYFSDWTKMNPSLKDKPEYIMSCSINEELSSLKAFSKNIDVLPENWFQLDILDIVEPNKMNVIKSNWTPKIRSALKFGLDALKSGDGFVIHCTQGFSRSTAMTYGVLCASGLSPKEAYKLLLERSYVYQKKKEIVPNQYAVEIMDELLGLDGEMLKVEYDYISDNYKTVLTSLESYLSESVDRKEIQFFMEVVNNVNVIRNNYIN